MWCALYVAGLQGDLPQFHNGGAGNVRQRSNGNGANGKWLGSGGARAYNPNRWWQGPPVAPVAQLDRALPSEGRGQRFESSRVRQSFQWLTLKRT